jgi:hypothetical protein
MADDVVTPSNPLVMLVEKQKLKETPFDVNVSQQSCKKPLRKMVYIRIDHSTWDC